MLSHVSHVSLEHALPHTFPLTTSVMLPPTRREDQCGNMESATHMISKWEILFSQD